MQGVPFVLVVSIAEADPYCFPSSRDSSKHRLLLQDADRRHDGGVHHQRTHRAERTAGAQVSSHSQDGATSMSSCCLSIHSSCVAVDLCCVFLFLSSVMSPSKC